MADEVIQFPRNKYDNVHSYTKHWANEIDVDGCAQVEKGRNELTSLNYIIQVYDEIRDLLRDYKEAVVLTSQSMEKAGNEIFREDEDQSSQIQERLGGTP